MTTNSMKRWASRVTVAILFAGSMQALAGFAPPPGPQAPLTPILPLPAPPRITLSPIGTVFADFNVAKSVTLRWNQPVATAHYGPVDPGLFVVCIQAPNVACVWQATAAKKGVWSGDATDTAFVTRTPNYVTTPFNNIQILESYTYTKTISLSNTFYDRDLKWTVAACVGPSTSQCTLGTATTNFYTTKEISDVTGQMTSNSVAGGRELFVSLEYKNTGTSDIANFSATTQVLVAIVNGGTCETNPAVAAGSSTPRVVLNNGQIIRAEDPLPKGTYIRAILPSIGDGSPLRTFQNLSLAANTTSGVYGTPTDAFAATWSFQWLTGETELALVAVTNTDTAGNVREVNENDNGWSRCIVYFP